MEQRINKVYNPDILAPTAFDFLQLYTKEARLGKLASCRAHYYCERSVQVRRKGKTGTGSLEVSSRTSPPFGS
jgi:hypothetical protein